MNLSFLGAAAIIFISMSLTWLLQLKNKNAGIVDVTWSYNFSFIVLVLYFFQRDSFGWADFLLLTMVVLWSARLGTYLFIRNVGKPEDARYTQLRKEWGKWTNIKMLLFFYLQGILNLILSIPFFIYFQADKNGLSAFEIIGSILFVIALWGESLADAQLRSFKKNPSNKGQVCQKGLWNYSRHPNYFFEWLIWISFFVFTLHVPYGYLSIISPLIILWTLLKATGIPMTEEQSIKSKGNLYKEYQKTTSAFIPWFKKQ